MAHNWGDRSGDREALRGIGWTSTRATVWHRDNGLCQHIRYDTGLPCYLTGDAVDHIKPLSLGGLSIASNLQVLCRWHHNKKTAQEAADARRARAKTRAQSRTKPHPGSAL
ncbi:MULTISPECIES: HNH endonuclease [Streptomyces]